MFTISTLVESVSEWIYNTVTLGAPAVHHSQFTHGGLRRMKAGLVENNKRLCFLQDKLQEILVLNGDIDDALDHLSHIIESPSTTMERSVLKLSLQRVIKAVSREELFSHTHWILALSSIEIIMRIIRIDFFS